MSLLSIRLGDSSKYNLYCFTFNSQCHAILGVSLERVSLEHTHHSQRANDTAPRHQAARMMTHKKRVRTK